MDKREISRPTRIDVQLRSDVPPERPISDAYPVIDNDLARDNIENDLTAADRQDV